MEINIMRQVKNPVNLISLVKPFRSYCNQLGMDKLGNNITREEI